MPPTATPRSTRCDARSTRRRSAAIQTTLPFHRFVARSESFRGGDAVDGLGGRALGRRGRATPRGPACAHRRGRASTPIGRCATAMRCRFVSERRAHPRDAVAELAGARRRPRSGGSTVGPRDDRRAAPWTASGAEARRGESRRRRARRPDRCPCAKTGRRRRRAIGHAPPRPRRRTARPRGWRRRRPGHPRAVRAGRPWARSAGGPGRWVPVRGRGRVGAAGRPAGAGDRGRGRDVDAEGPYEVRASSREGRVAGGRARATRSRPASSSWSSRR